MSTPDQSTKLRRRVIVARQRLEHEISMFGLAYGEAQWTNGYRASKGVPLTKVDDLYLKEVEQWKHLGRVRAKVNQALAAYTRALRAEQRAR